MTLPHYLADVLTRYIDRAGYTSGQLARLTGIPKATLVNWMEGRVKRPRGSKDLIKLATVLHLDEVEASQLLQAAGHLSVAELREQALQADDPVWQSLLAPWSRTEQPRMQRIPFQAIADLPHFVGPGNVVARA